MFMAFKTKRASVLALVRPFVLCLAPLLIPFAATAAEPEVPSPSNYGGAGLLDMRTARFLPDGYISFSTSFTQPDDRYALTFQALPWAEFTFRYAITRAIFDSGVPIHDRSFDAKFRLSHETEYVPELALGLQDFLGTGIYSAEYLTGSKRWGPFDFTIGLGWGRLASRPAFGNPFGSIFKSFLTRSANTGSGGLLLFKNYFRGPDTGVFGGIEYNTPIDNLTLKIEYSSDTYAAEKAGSGKDFHYPINFGASYRPFPWLDVGLSLMHGRIVSLRVSTPINAAADNWQARLNPPPRFRARTDGAAGTILQPDTTSATASPGAPETRFVDLTVQREQPQPTPDRETSNSAVANPPPPNLPAIAPPPAVVPPPTVVTPPAIVPPPAIVARAAQASPTTPASLDAATSDRLKAGFDSQKVVLLGVSVEDDKLIILIENATYRRDSEAIARAARVLSAVAPPQINYFEITFTSLGLPLTTVTLPRTEIDKLARREGSAAELFYGSELSPGVASSLDHLPPNLFPQIGGSIYPVFRQSLFDPDNPVFIFLGVGANGGVRLAPGWFLEGTAVASLWNDFNQIKRATNSVLPHVRSDVANYLKEETIGLENISTAYFFKLAPEISGRVEAGYLEQMFAGVGGELLYRPFGQRWAIGVDLWTVRQRGYDVLLDLRNYQVFTGHLTAYYDVPWHDVRLAVSAGQYLAGDKGVTFQFSRRFSTGVEIGAWFTLTNVSAARFGEGSFDKGIRLVIPFEWVAPFATRSGYDLSLRSIQRDGGQRLLGDAMLYGLTDASSYGALTQEWNSVFR